jgi:hypothetical protein
MEATPSGAVRVRYRPTAEDHLALYARQVWSAPVHRAARIGLAVLAGVLIAVYLVPRGLAGMAGAVGVGIGVVALWLAGPTLARRRIARLYQDGPGPPEVEYRVDHEGVHGTSARARWSDVVRVEESPAAFVVWIRPGAGAYLPRRAIADADLRALRALFHTHAGGRARLRSD